MNQSYRLSDIVGRFGGELVGDGDTRISQVATLANAESTDISFLSSGKYRQQLETTRAAAVILGRGDRDAANMPRIVCDNPYVYFARVSSFLNPAPEVEPGIHYSAVIAGDAQIDPLASIGPFCSIGRNARIGKHSVIASFCCIGENAVIGDGVRMYSGVTIYADCIVGND